MTKNIIIIVLALANAILMHRPHINSLEYNRLIELTTNRIMHEQIDGTWPQAYGSTMESARKFEEDILKARKQGITDWKQYKP